MCVCVRRGRREARLLARSKGVAGERRGQNIVLLDRRNVVWVQHRSKLTLRGICPNVLLTGCESVKQIPLDDDDGWGHQKPN